MNGLLLAVCVLLSGTHTAFLKFYQRKHGSTTPVSLLFTGFMTLSIALMSFITLYASGGSLTWSLISTLLSAVMGFLYTINLPLGAVAYSLGNIAISGVFLSLGSLLLPFLYGVIFLDELSTLSTPSLILRLVGFLAAIGIIFLQLLKKKGSGKMSLKFFFTCLCMLLVNGIFCVLVKVQSMEFPTVAKPQVMFFAGIFGAFFSFLFLLLAQLRSKNGVGLKNGTDDSKNVILQKEPFAAVAEIPKKSLIFPVCYGLFNGTINMLNLFLGSRIDATVHYPVLSCGGVLVTTIFAFIVFHEKITSKHLITIGLCLVTILCFSF